MEEDFEDTETQKRRRCIGCDREIRLGEDCITVNNGVIGPRGFVPLGETIYLCNQTCCENHFNPDATPVEKTSRRIP